MPEQVRVRFSILPPELKVRAIPYLGILVVATALAVLLTLAPLWTPQPSEPQWFWLLGGCATVGCITAVLTLRMRATQTSAQAQIAKEGGRAVLLSAVAVSRDLGPEGLISKTDHKVSKGWLWMGDHVITVAAAGMDTPRTVTPAEIKRVAEVRVLGGIFTEPQLAISLSDGTVVEAIPTRGGLRGIFPYGRRRLRELLSQLEDFSRSR